MKTRMFTIAELAEVFKKRQLNKFDVVCLIDGPRGNGKSTLAYKILRRMGNFKPKDDIMFSRDDVMNGLKSRRFGKIFADEMINSAHNRDFFSGNQKELIKWLNMYRDNHNILIGCVPNFYDIDPQIRKLTKFRITVVERGKAIVQIAKNSLYMNDPWDTDSNRKIEMKWTSKSRYKKLSTYQGMIKFGPLKPNQEKIYTTLKRLKREEMLENEREEEPKNSKVEYPSQAIQLIQAGLIKGKDDLIKFFDANDIDYPSGCNAINRELAKRKIQHTLFALLKHHHPPEKNQDISLNEGNGNFLPPITSKTT